MHPLRQKVDPILNPRAVHDRALEIRNILKEKMDKCIKGGMDSAFSKDPKCLSLHFYGAIRVWEVSLGIQDDDNGQWYWGFFLITDDEVDDITANHILRVWANNWEPDRYSYFVKANGNQDVFISRFAALHIAAASAPLEAFSPQEE